MPSNQPIHLDTIPCALQPARSHDQPPPLPRRTGNRKPLRPLAYTGLTLALLSLPLIALTATKWWQNFDPTPYLPFSMLEDRYKHNDPKARDVLAARLKDGKLSKSQATQLVQDMTFWQDDPSIHVFGWPFDLVASSTPDLRRAGVAPAVLDNYTDHPYRIEPAWRATVSPGDTFPIRITLDVRPRDAFHQFLWEINSPKAWLEIDGTRIDLPIRPELYLDDLVYLHDALTVGTDDARFWKMERNGQIQGTLFVEADFGDPRTARSIHRSFPFATRVVPRTVITTVSDPMIDARLQAALSTNDIQMNGEGQIEVERPLQSFRINIATLPENVAADVFFEQAGHKWNQGVLIRPAGAAPAEIWLTPAVTSSIKREDPPRYYAGVPWPFGGMSFVEFVTTDLNPNLPLYLVFDSNPTLAATHTAFDHIWQGQVRLPIKINIIKP